MANKDPAKQREAQQKHYYANKAKEVEKSYRRKVARKKRLKELADQHKGVPCVDCEGEFHPVAMDFHHVDSKDDCIGNLVRRGVSEKRLLEEIAKCEVVCANCHRVKTFMENIAG